MAQAEGEDSDRNWRRHLICWGRYEPENLVERRAAFHPSPDAIDQLDLFIGHVPAVFSSGVAQPEDFGGAFSSHFSERPVLDPHHRRALARPER